MPRMLASPGTPSRDEHALAAVTANGGAALRGAKPRGGSFSATKATSKRRPTARGTPLWCVAVFASVALNVATLTLLLHHYAVSYPVASSDDKHLDACVLQADISAAPAQHEELMDRAARAPSTGKPAVTHDSVINLDQ